MPPILSPCLLQQLGVHVDAVSLLNRSAARGGDLSNVS